MEDCLFCKIVKGEIPSEFLYEDEWVVAFNDINPQAPTHVLVIPKRHISSFREINDNDGKMLVSVAKAARSIVGSDDFRIVSNVGKGAGQTVFHLHFHILAGRNLAWPPG